MPRDFEFQEELPLDDERPSRGRARNRHDSTQFARSIVWAVALTLILGFVIYGFAKTSNVKGELGILATYGWVVVSLPPSILIYILARCVDGILGK